MKFLIHNIEFRGEGEATVAFSSSDGDVKVNGLIRVVTLQIPAGDEYDQGIEAVHEAAVELVKDVLDDFGRLENADLSALTGEPVPIEP